MRKFLFTILLLAGCGQSIVPEVPLITGSSTPATVISTANGSTIEPTFDMTRGSSLSMWVLHWRATVTNAGDKISHSVLIECLDAAGNVRAANEQKCEIGPGNTMNISGDMDVPETEIFKLKQVRISLINFG
jgi:hypothetical protein